MAMSIPILARGSSNIKAWHGPPNLSLLNEFPTLESKSCRCMVFSSDGALLACVTGNSLSLFRTENWQKIFTVDNTKAYYVTFSPKNTYLMTWETFTVSKDRPEGSPNLNIYSTNDGKLVKSFVQKKQVNWEPQFSQDEKLCTRLVNTDIVFYEDSNFDKIVSRVNCCKVASYKLSPNVGTYFFMCFTAGVKGQPSYIRLFKYPNLELIQAIANKSFFQADKVEVLWNAKGNNALLLTSTEVDKTGGSYYGKQGLHFMSLKGETAMIPLSKEGPIYSVEWSPRNDEFCVVYGFMPAKATIFNLKAEPVFELGTGAKNSVYYNPFGNILLLGGFGNLQGQVETWDAVNKKKVGTFHAPDTTLLQWSADGEHILTATTAPRLRTANGFRIYHFSGALLHEISWPQGEELYEVSWKPYPKLAFKEPVTSKKVEGIAPSQPQASKQAYRPPSARNRPESHVKFSLHNEDEDAHKVENQLSKSALKNKKKREAKKAKQGEDIKEQNEAPAFVSAVSINLTGDPEMDKKLKNIKKKLDAIEKLKRDQASGKTLEKNQLEKIKGEAELLTELEQLTL